MGRTILPEAAFTRGHHASPAFVRRREVLRETVAALSRGTPDYHALARANLDRWRGQATSSAPGSAPRVRVMAGDWGEVSLELTREHGRIFAVLNMANAFVPGGGYVEGSPAQEENMFRRTDCHFAIGPEQMDPDTERYRPELTALLEAEPGRVLLDTDRPRVCIRGLEDRARPDLGYAWLAHDEVFPFFELRAAALDLRGGRPFDPGEARRRIEAQLNTLIDAGIRHAVLSAFGCGAFMNPADEVAAIYREALRERAEAFACVAFAIFNPGYGPDNFTPFCRAFVD